ncbi:MAG: M48 family metallopeptidase, partial [Myxococcales bacterium]|nr:M48 family metallopeptidase [Myxococcales bacterium]
MPVPTIYVANSPVINAYTFGTDEESFIVVHGALVDHFDEEELKFVIGHETGHIQNKHVVYGTALILMERSVGAFLRWVLPPAELALQAWYRRAEVTCDRAGLLCVDDPRAPARAFLKMACGSKKLYDEINPDAYLAQLEEGRTGLGRFS